MQEYTWMRAIATLWEVVATDGGGGGVMFITGEPLPPSGRPSHGR